MRKLTLAQRRERALINFNSRYIDDYENAKKIIGSYNRLCGLCDTLLILQNDSKLYDSRYTHELEEKETRWIERLNGYLKPYGLSLCFCSHIPTIGIVKNHCLEETAYFKI